MLGVLIGVIISLGYLGIIFEEQVRVNKAASALLTGILCWISILAFGDIPSQRLILELKFYVFEIHQVIFFLMGAMLIVEVIDAYKGFDLISRILSGRHHLVLFFLIHVIGFFLSSILDNLTTIIILICILKKLIPDSKERLIYSASLVFAVNAGGAWTPIGDVTTTMLWVEEKISTGGVMQALFIPSLLSSSVFAILMSLKLPKVGVINDQSIRVADEKGTKRVLFTGLAGLLLAPILKTLLELPPFMSVLLGVAILWVVTDLSISSESEDKQHLRVFNALGRIDISSLLFFFGILLAVDALDVLGYLSRLSLFLESTLPSQNFVSIVMGYLSAIIDNVPLVSASIKIYDTLVLDHPTWFMIAYCAGVGGSLLIIGSAPGVALMSMEKISFKWYFKNIFVSAMIAYMLGVASLLYLV